MQLSQDLINQWMRRIADSGLSVDKFFASNEVPFGRANYFRYKKVLSKGNDLSTAQPGRKKKVGEREEMFLRGVVAGGNIPSIDELRGMFETELGTKIGRTAILRTLDRLFPNRERSKVGRPITNEPEISINALGGFELIIAVAYHLKWPERVASVISDCVHDHVNNAVATQARKDLICRGDGGHFTKEYNQREDVRTSRFSSIEEKRKAKRWDSMAIMRDQTTTLSRKSLSILSLPVVTANGNFRNVGLDFRFGSIR